MKPPAFQLYAADFYMDVSGWTNEEVGTYFRLLMHSWVNGPLPNDMGELSRITQSSAKKFTNKWQKLSIKFTLNGDGKYINTRLEQTREEQANYRESLSEAGKKGAKKRWGKGGDLNNHPNNHPNGKNIALQSSSSSSIETKEKISKKKRAFIPPTLSEVIAFFKENGYTQEGATEAYKYYAENDWKDGQDKQVLNWKQKMRGNQFYDSRKAEGKESWRPSEAIKRAAVKQQ